jgi:hypothetical protein
MPEPSSYASPSIASAARDLRESFDEGHVERADAIAGWLSRAADASTLRRYLAPLFVTRLSSAGHSPILLHLMGRIAVEGEAPAQCLLRNVARGLASNPAQRWHWIPTREESAATRAEDPSRSSVGEEVSDALRRIPLVRNEPTGGIFGLVEAAEKTGDLERHLGFLRTRDLGDATRADDAYRAICRTAARAMLLEPARHAKYGWTHCLTLPQAAWANAAFHADPGYAVCAAASFVGAFRSALATTDWAPARVHAPAPAESSLARAVRSSPEDAISAALHTPRDGVDDAFTELASSACVRVDAHLVKYTLASWDCASRDPLESRLYLAAAARLLSLWMEDDPDARLPIS